MTDTALKQPFASAGSEEPAQASSPLSLILVVPGLSVEAERAFDDWVTYLNGLDREYEIVLICERQGTSLDGLAARCTRAKAIPTPADGFGVALREGLKVVRHPLLCYTTCDRRYKPQDLKNLLKWIGKAHMVCGRRAFPARQAPCRRYGVAFRWLVRMVFGVRLKDLECLYVLARRSLFARIPIQSEGEFAHIEVLAKANFLGCVMTDAEVACEPESSPPGPSLDWRADFRQLYKRPDFGPIQV